MWSLNDPHDSLRIPYRLEKGIPDVSYAYPTDSKNGIPMDSLGITYGFGKVIPDDPFGFLQET